MINGNELFVANIDLELKAINADLVFFIVQGNQTIVLSLEPVSICDEVWIKM